MVNTKIQWEHSTSKNVGSFVQALELVRQREGSWELLEALGSSEHLEAQELVNAFGPLWIYLLRSVGSSWELLGTHGSSWELSGAPGSF